MGSVAYKLALVSAGLADITFTLTPKNEWDVAAGAALVLGGGGFVKTLENAAFTGNNRNPLLSGLLAGGPFLEEELLSCWRAHRRATPPPASRRRSIRSETSGARYAVWSTFRGR